MKVSITLPTPPSRDYEIIIDELPSIEIEGKAAIVTNPKVAGLHLQRLLQSVKAKELYIVTIPDGEEYKTMETIEFMLDRFFDHRLDRKSTLIAFGGGVIGDMTGFAASIFQRGIDFIQVPTTLLSQVDASVGGKTGINNRFGKNLVGAFHQPKAVYIDTFWLKTLPKREFSAGIAEIIKMAVMFDADFFDWLEKNDLYEDSNLKEAIKRSVELKARVVNEDEKEKGVRAVLNYGHTFAHVIENFSGYGSYLHGEAVAIGMVMANDLAQEFGYFSKDESERVKELLKKYNLPVSYSIESAEKFYDQFFLDKKSHDNKITFIIPENIGKYKMLSSPEKESVIKVLKKFEKAEGF
ncbi:3-dehydroquinate synthase [Hydrogenimonas thermophila]|uniref:3-dehydroquinate synthase n=1 Tax=Hydrogenimonas thermophila TaxID=223786 RepID=UPI002936F21E|nr:3-dehydroquinate synthase [Hydrogenimonas thermophila]WOE69146.1 3-dehydroquinate synthase [Hydrogenimonas thermophila]WOE71656.1 3-dehydroquinate synthase [Hydrogenimonas thermophila]